jgi:RNA polymerase sigma factor (sigma-70 family)
LALDSDEKHLVTMHYLEGYKYTEMAEILGRSAGALRVAVHRAINKLKRGER